MPQSPGTSTWVSSPAPGSTGDQTHGTPDELTGSFDGINILSSMSTRSRSTEDALVQALKRVARTRPVADISFVDIAREAGVSPQTALRHLKSKAHMAELLGMPADMPLDTRSRLLVAAGRVMADKGYAGATLDDIGAAAGVTKGAIYWSYASKADLFLDLVDQRAKSDWTQIERWVDAAIKAADGATALRQVLTLVLDRVQADRDWPRLYLEFMAQTRDPEVLARLSRYQAEGLQSIAAIVRRLQTAGAIPARKDADRLALLIAAFFDGFVVGALLNPRPLPAESLATDFAGLLQG